MSDFPPPGGPPAPPSAGPAPGWWQASDGNWYPPDQQPGFAAPAYGAPPGYGYPVAAPYVGNNGMAIASLICSVTFPISCGLTAPLGIIFGHIALSQIKRSGEKGRGMAVAGLVVGYLTVIVAVALIVWAVALAEDTSSNFNDFDGDGFDDFNVLWRSWR